MRDTQRQKLYDAEGLAFGEAEAEMTLDECQALVDKVLASKVIQRKYRRAQYQLTVTDGRSRRSGGYFAGWDDSTIALPRWARQKWVVLHETAHHLAHGPDAAGHGWQFAACYLYLVRVYMGKGQEQALMAAFKAKRVRFREPRTRTMSETQRQAARERMLVMHAAARAA
jgi:putative metallohydrolase (TIGR04338 family)